MAKKPNILMILSDQHRYDCVGFSDAYPVKTPNLDKLAEEGVWFENAYTTIPTCCPARMSLIAGRRPESFGAYWNYDITLPIKTLEPSEYSWIRDLLENGYNTGWIGKWHINPDHGAEEFGYTDVINSEREYLAKYGSRYHNKDFSWMGWEENCDLEDTHTAFLAKLTNDKLEELSSKDEPWLLSVNFEEPHPPYVPHKDFAAMYKPENIPQWTGFEDDFLNKPYIQKQQLVNWNMQDYTWQDWAPAVARYYAIVSETDYAIGKMLNKLKELGLEEDTIIIYSSDHGDMCGSHRMFDKHYILYEDVTHVPLIIKYGSKLIPKKTKDYTVHFLDLVPTILEMTGVPCSAKELHGRSLVPALEGNTPKDWPQEAVTTYNGQQFGLYNQRCIKTDNFKYVWNLTDIDELYDLQKDKGELINLIDEPAYTETLTILRKRLYEILVQQKDYLSCRTNVWAANIQLLEQRKLGNINTLELKK